MSGTAEETGSEDLCLDSCTVGEGTRSVGIASASHKGCFPSSSKGSSAEMVCHPNQSDGCGALSYSELCSLENKFCKMILTGLL